MDAPQAAPQSTPGAQRRQPRSGGRSLPGLRVHWGDPVPWLLGMALALGLVRFVRLGTFGLWLDEALTWTDYHHSLRGQIANPVGYLLIGWTVELLGGEPTELALRLLPAIVGWLCIPLTYWAFRAPAGRERAAVAALLVAVASWHVFWSQSARFYTLAQATSLLGAGLWARGLLSGRFPAALAGMAVAAMAAAFHPTSAFLVPALLVAPFAPRLVGASFGKAPERVALWLAGIGAVVALAGSPWAWRWFHHHAWQKPLAEPMHLALTAGYYFTPLLLAAALLGGLGALRRREPFLLAAAAVAALAFGSALVVSTMAQMTAQYVFVLLPWVALLAAALVAGSGVDGPGVAGPAGEPGPRRGVSPALVVLLVLPALADTALLLTRRHGGRARWREAYEYVAERRQSGDMVLGHASKLGELYLGHAATELRSPVRVSMLNLWSTRAPRHWTRHDRTIWVVYRPQWLAELEPEDQVMVERWLREECRLVERFPVEAEGRQLDVEVYRRP